MRIIFLGMALVAPYVAGQTSAAPTAPSTPRIEVATIKPASLDSLPVGAFQRLSNLQKGCPQIGPVIAGNRIAWSNASVCALVRSAYNLELSQLGDEPKWFRASGDPKNYFDINMQVEIPEGTTVTREQAKDVLQQLLADRFHLTIHRTMKEIPVYEMTVDKGGLKVLSTRMPVCDQSSRPGKFLQDCTANSTMTTLARNFSGAVDRPVVDKTGYDQKFAYLVSWNDPDGLNPSPEFFTAVREQLGIRLEPGKANVDVLVIDQIERPSEN